MLIVSLIGITKKTGDKWRNNQNHTISINDTRMSTDITEEDIKDVIKTEYHDRIILGKNSKIKIMVDTKTRKK